MREFVAIAGLTWTIVLGMTAYTFGRYEQATTDKAERAQELENENELARLKNRKSLAAGIRTEQAQAKTEQFFYDLRSDYESEQREDPAIGCVLDPVSLRRWNEANAQSNSAAPGEPAAGMRNASDAQTGRERGE